MINFPVALIYIGFFGLIGAAVYLTGSALPLFALILVGCIPTNVKGG
jgi:hypothetical protein